MTNWIRDSKQAGNVKTCDQLDTGPQASKKVKTCPQASRKVKTCDQLDTGPQVSRKVKTCDRLDTGPQVTGKVKLATNWIRVSKQQESKNL